MKRQLLKVIVLMLASVRAAFATHAAVGDMVASANSQKKAQSSGKKPNPTHAKAPVSHPKTTKKKKGKKKK